LILLLTCSASLDAISNSINILFATVDAAVVQMWANTDVSVTPLQSASVVMIAPEKCSQHHKCALTSLLCVSPMQSLQLGFFSSLGTLSMSVDLRLDLLTTLSANQKLLR
jgi:hypothetical protein